MSFLLLQNIIDKAVYNKYFMIYQMMAAKVELDVAILHNCTCSQTKKCVLQHL